MFCDPRQGETWKTTALTEPARRGRVSSPGTTPFEGFRFPLGRRKCENDRAFLLSLVSRDWFVLVAFTAALHQVTKVCWNPNRAKTHEIAAVIEPDGPRTAHPPQVRADCTANTDRAVHSELVRVVHLGWRWSGRACACEKGERQKERRGGGDEHKSPLQNQPPPGSQYMGCSNE